MKNQCKGSFRNIFACLCVASIVIYCTIFKLKWLEVLKSDLGEFGNILESRNQPEGGKNVFFIDSSESKDNVTLNARKACAIESAAFTNPHLKIFLLFSSESRFEALETTPVLKAILSYSNVFINFLNATQFSVESSMEDFFESNALSTSSFKIEHTSDALRLLVLWKYGGTYLDTDMIVRRKLDSLPSNLACRQSKDEINNAFLRFSNQKDGHELAELFITNFVLRFNGAIFPWNGPKLITRVVKDICGTNDVQNVIDKNSCQGFFTLDSPFCYEISYSEWNKLMEENFTEEVLQRVEQSITVHFWNHVTRDVKLSPSSKAPYIMLARQFCPKVLKSCGEFF